MKPFSRKMEKNLLIQGDNIKGMNYLLEDHNLKGKIDLVYIDPPFATKNTFSISKQSGKATAMSISKDSEVAYTDNLVGKEFIDFLYERLLIIKELLSDKGSIYLHTDYKIGHYVKVMMDEVFGIENFKNDISRIKCNPKNFKRIGYGNIKDLILFYTKTDTPIWNEPMEDFSEDDLKRLFPKIDKDGRRYGTVALDAPGENKTTKLFKGRKPAEGRHWAVDIETMEELDNQGLIEWSTTGNPRRIMYADERKKIGKRVQDIWTGLKDPTNPKYPTEKNLEMLERIILTSSNPDSIVMDCFCGGGTTLVAANKHGRQYIGIDISPLAINIAKERLGIAEANIFNTDTEFISLT